jgi:hypothetical protein
MTTIRRLTPTSKCTAALGALVLASLCGAAQAQDASTMSPQAKYDKDRAHCMSGKSQEDQATCLREAGAALQARKDGDISHAPKDAAALQSNAVQRCDNLPPKDRPDCMTRAKAGVSQGAANSGGDIKETVTVKVGPRGGTVPPGSTQIGEIPAAVIPPPPSFASAPQ